MRKITFWNEMANAWEFKASIRMITHDELRGVIAIALGSVEYTDNSWVDIYSIDGELVGTEWFN